MMNENNVPDNVSLQLYPDPVAVPKNGCMLRVAAYIRVSTEGNNQEDSYQIQSAYFEELLAQNPNWISAGVYSDYGISGTCHEKRTGFNRLMRHCKEGRIDRIITKSISRFSRNTRDFLKALEVLKANHVTIVFEKEHMDTAVAQNDMMITAFGAVAQEESRSISANIRWGMEQRRQRGEVHNICLYGYRYAEGENSCEVTERGYRFRRIMVYEEEAAVVRRIFEEVVEGKKYVEIARELNFDKIPPPKNSIAWRRVERKGIPDELHNNSERDAGWTGRQISQVIRLERYAGDVRMAKTYTEDYKTHKTIVNKGQKDQFYVKDHHPAIVSRELFEQAQILSKINRDRVQKKGEQRTRYPFSGRLVCMHCGRFYWTRNRASAPIWACASTMTSAGKRVCSAQKIYEAQIIRMCRRAVIDRYGLANGPTDQTLEKSLIDGEYIKADVSFVMQDRGLIKVLLHALETVGIYDDMERERSFLHRKIASCMDEIDHARQLLEVLKANVEIAQSRQEVLHQEVDEEELTMMQEQITETRRILEEREADMASFKKQLQHMEQFWMDSEADHVWRQKAIRWMKTLPDGQEGIRQFFGELTSEYIRAFILSIKVESPFKYCIHWFDDVWTEVEMNSNVEQED